MTGTTSINICHNVNKLGISTISVNQCTLSKLLVNNTAKTDKFQTTGV